MEINPLQYPIGKFSAPENITPEIRQAWIQTLADFPEKLQEAIKGMSEESLAKPYRPGGWTARQVIHHVYDSHMNSFIRFKMALTEDKPIIKAYSEADWANLPDGNEAPIEWSIEGLKYVHLRWVYLLRTFQESDWKNAYTNPERGITYPLDRALGIYAWHCDHHLAHVLSVK
ncbi:YfiT family bacillithiol transferase [Aquirufa rosea]|uniref:Putative metal-dependent hydrolase n=1 Tax=Aquirufa rosea TaxID=2509241 RepID=A0A4V1M5K3_9BACT|nr:putative metal-dependent hydrolase [Aquirufa rosea]RXK50701.1 putative metal-dependent hydrolase [Aquirufa rosea]